jgi:limonene-1,2-epoxide hydrolase
MVSGRESKMQKKEAPMSVENEKIVTEFCKSLESGNLTTLVSYLSADVVYHNIPWQPVTGHAGVRQVLGPFLEGPGRATVKMNIKNTTSSGNTVMNERLEEWTKGTVKLDLPVLGVFELKDGKITQWRDYFDANTVRPLAEAIQ